MTPEAPRPAYQLDRIKALTDGVLAIVLTILVLGFEVPEHDFSREGLAAFLAKLRDPFLAYVVSFGIVAAYWIQHAAIFHYVRVGDRAFVWLNLLFLLPLSLLPFFTDLRVEFRDEYRVTVLYAAANVCSGLILMTLWGRAVRRGLTRTLPGQVFRSMRRRIAIGVLLNVLGAALATIDVKLSSLAFLAVPTIYLSHRVVDLYWSEGQD